ncbi:ADP-ribosylglycohydrolase family protein [Coraliomargarita akajimensis]|uniref:ADP-ribosylation/Crystallin J1 n=1 Tax=Coraliomargarita akajimensis (strain DSM 45221 / IAM 15411 / JCM 23193 / KCTC 12865 / 04OKA010-24) TaxID=583355 RepID=D5EPW2_CORAD|nr:ADP-ribosylglycohydrolase family protein [Coraliomargarita akajimensis]ADE55695.1 ADP-ribosylation/Crystallin J1 [Coraliomargarita akajimensis DSM 45221]
MNDRIQNALLGALVADAVAMPVHWYYDVEALDRDYAPLTQYVAPKNPHPDSILWRSSYTARSKEFDILHGQEKYWGTRGVHYHQFLAAGENTVNFLLGIQLYRSVVRAGAYEPEAWLRLYVQLMRHRGWHQDTYLEEYHRAFFNNLADGKAPEKCGIVDIHIGGLTSVPFLYAALDALGEPVVDTAADTIVNHVGLTHQGSAIAAATETFVRLLACIGEGAGVREAIEAQGSVYGGAGAFETWMRFEDRQVIGKHLTPACYLPDSFTASLYLAWKYHDQFEQGIIANALCGGDNCHRGAVVGALLGAANGVPEEWLTDLKSMRRLRCDTLDPVFSE